ncbi:MAG: VCBS domain-containing protein, partial [Methylococcales bacterium]|nr:VCBS domain-containing protein [Methylococcales bacterium]
QLAVAGQYGVFNLGTDGAWTYDATTAHDEFQAGTTYTDTFNVFSADGTESSVTNNILGTNDAAVITPAVADLVETDVALNTSGQLLISDVDSAATFVEQLAVAGQYGVFNLGTDGAWTYDATTAHDEFQAGTTYTDTFNVFSADGP